MNLDELNIKLKKRKRIKNKRKKNLFREKSEKVHFLNKNLMKNFFQFFLFFDNFAKIHVNEILVFIDNLLFCLRINL